MRSSTALDRVKAHQGRLVEITYGPAEEIIHGQLGDVDEERNIVPIDQRDSAAPGTDPFRHLKIGNIRRIVAQDGGSLH